MKFKRIDFVLENCEVVSINPQEKYITSQIFNIKQNANSQDNEYWINNTAEYIEIKIDAILKENFYFHNEAVPGEKSAWFRLNHKDVTSICFIHEDDSEFQIYVPWGSKDFINTKMKITEKTHPNMKGLYLYIIFDNRNILTKLKWKISNFLYRIKR